LAKFIITAQPCTFEQRNGYVAKSYMLMQEPLSRYATECKTVAELVTDMQALARQVRTRFSGSFFVSETLERGQRAPAGYRQRRPREVDCEEVRPVVGGSSPWGTIQTIHKLGPHCVGVETASHGGIWVDAAGLELIPEPFRKTGFSDRGWFEEDCDWAIPYVFCGLAEHDRPDHLTAAEGALQRWHPTAWQAWSGSVREAVAGVGA
jgi:hypothetical protein